jgi:hypothetical protein
MSAMANALVGLVAAEHLWFLVLEPRPCSSSSSCADDARPSGQWIFIVR